MSSWYDRFVKTWASTGVATDPSDAQANAGFSFLGATPPSVELFNAMFKWDDQKDTWLFNQIANAVTGSGGTITEANLNALRDAILGLKNLSGALYYNTAGTTTFVQGTNCPTSITRIQVEVWGGGGGSSGGAGASGSGGGYSLGTLTLTAGQSITVIVGAAGAAATYPAVGGTGGTSSCSTITATGGGGGGAGVGAAGIGSGGTINLAGQAGMDLDQGTTVTQGSTGMAVGGSSPRGGYGGSMNAAGGLVTPTAPGGGGGGNAAFAAGANGAIGGVLIRW